MTATASKYGRQEILPLAWSPIMRKRLMLTNSICRLLTLLLILPLCFVQAQEFRFPDRFPPGNFPDNFNAEGDESIVQSYDKRYHLWNSCSQHYVRITAPGKRGVDARGEKNASFTTLILRSVGPNGLTLIQGTDNKSFLCFSKKGRLRAKTKSSAYCTFNHTITDNYDQFRLAVNPRWYIGFQKSKKKNRRAMGKPLPAYKKIPGSKMEKCYNFLAFPLDGYTRNDRQFPVDFYDKSLIDYDPEPETRIRTTFKAKGRRKKNRKRNKRRRWRERRRQKKKNR